MCRFSGPNDDNWRKVGPQLKHYYEKIVGLQVMQLDTLESQQEPEDDPLDSLANHARSKFGVDFLELLASLSYDSMGDAEHEITMPLDETCQWIFRLPKFNSWIDSCRGSDQPKILYLTGKLGSGKSTLMRHVVTTLKHQSKTPIRNVVAFFFASSKDAVLNRTSSDVSRSLLSQLFRIPSFREDALKFMDKYGSKLLLPHEKRWHPGELHEAVMDLFRQPRTDEVIIFVDAVDECMDADKLVRFLQDMLSVAHARNSKRTLKICLSWQGSPPLTDEESERICIEDHNQDDIALYVHRRLHAGSLLSQDHYCFLQNSIIEKASGVFLWVILVVDLIQKHLHDGRDFQFLKALMDETPGGLKGLYRDILVRFTEKADPITTSTMIGVLQWVLFSARLLTIDEWHHVLAFIQNPFLQSIKEWEVSETFTESDDLLIQRIKRVCRGFVDVKHRQVPIDPSATPSEVGSLGVGAGSFESRQYIQVIHPSVRTFFLKENGFALLNPNITNPRAAGHLHILDVCIRYCFLEEMKRAFWVGPARAEKRKSQVDASKKGIWRIRSMIPSLQSRKARILQRTPSRAMSLGSSASSSAPSLYSDDTQPGQLAGKSSQANWKAFADETDSRNVGYSRDLMMKYVRGLEDPLQPASAPADIVSREVLRDTSSSRSTSSHEQAVYNPPALWYYSRNMLVHHAAAADQEGAHPGSPLDFLLSQDWKTWAATREDMQKDATLVYFAAQWNLESWLLYLLDEKSLDETVKGGLHSYPIVVAARMGCIEAFRCLFLRNFSNLLVTDPYGWTALHHAVLSRNNCIIDWLRKPHLSRQALRVIRRTINHKDRCGYTTLHLAALAAPGDVISDLVKLGADVHCVDKEGNTPLHFACSRDESDLSVCELLVNAGCDRIQRNNDGNFAFELALQWDHWDLVWYLSMIPWSSNSWPR